MNQPSTPGTPTTGVVQTPPPPTPTPLELQEQGRRVVRRIFLIWALGFLVLLIIGGVYGYIWHQSYYFYTTNDAFVTGNVSTVVSPWRAQVQTIYHHLGGYVHKNDKIYTLNGVSGPDSGGGDVLAPVEGTIINEYNLAESDQVGLNQPIVQIVRLSRLWVTAFVPEDHIRNVHVGQGVDVALPGDSNTFHGTVNRIVDRAAALTGTTYPSVPVPTTDYATGNYVPVTQRIPVQIRVDGSPGYPGQSATVTIHLRS